MSKQAPRLKKTANNPLFLCDDHGSATGIRWDYCISSDIPGRCVFCNKRKEVFQWYFGHDTMVDPVGQVPITSGFSRFRSSVRMDRAAR